jgi:putative ATP-binding cassette transporter
MKLLSFLIQCNIRRSLIVAGLSVVSGIGSAALLPIVNSALQLSSPAPHSKSLLVVALAATLLAKIVAGVASNLLLCRLAQESILKLCTGLCRKVAATPFRNLEMIGSHRILSCVTEDVNALSGAIQAIPLILINAVILTGCVVYLAWISWLAVLLLTLIMGLSALCDKFFIAKAYPAVRSARAGKETLFRHFRSLTDGIKELKIHRGRREAFFQEELASAAEHYRRQNVAALNRYALADAWSQAMFGILMATQLFVLPAWSHIAQPDLIKYVLVTLFLMSPAWNLIRSLPTLATGQASLERMQELGLTLEGLARAPSGPSDDQAPVSIREIRRNPPVVEFRNVTFSYRENGSSSFTVGPLNLTLHPGNLIFVIGGNGSGKSSFVKLLTGLYQPDKGEICIDGKPVSVANQEDYQQLFSVVYSDFYLFDRLLGVSCADLEQNVNGYLTALDLSSKVKLEGNSFSTTNVSQGQRRRLALLTAYMEDRPIYVLDEWAADQDPAFRQVFYVKLLPELKRRGKTVVVVTHDDRYFEMGDQLIKLEYGKVVEMVQSSATA